MTLLALLTICGSAVAQEHDSEELHQVAGILDYVGADYAGAVDEQGRVTNEAEYAEQTELLDRAGALARQAGIADTDALIRELATLRQEIVEKRPPGSIASRCRSVRTALVRDHGLHLEPPSPPDIGRGRELYARSGCVSCHGDDGSADTAQARALTPPPASFLDPKGMAWVSPYRAFHAITFGVPETGMAAHRQLSSMDRWDLAFFVLSLRHRPDSVARGQAIVGRLAPSFDAGAATLSQLTDDDLRQRLIAASVASPTDQEDAVAFLRGAAPFAVRAPHPVPPRVVVPAAPTGVTGSSPWIILAGGAVLVLIALSLVLFRKRRN